MRRGTPVPWSCRLLLDQDDRTAVREGFERLGEGRAGSLHVLVQSRSGLDRDATMMVVEPGRDGLVGQVIDPAAVAGRRRTPGGLIRGHSSTPIAPGRGTVPA